MRVGNGSAGLTEVVKKEFSVSGTPDVRLDTFDGAVEVRAWDRPDAVSIIVEKRAADREVLDAIEVVTEQDDTKITVAARRPPRRDVVTIGFTVSPSAKIIASVPRRVNLTISSGDGSISVERVDGRHDLRTVDGSIKGIGVSGQLLARTGDGSIQFEGFEGQAEVTSGDGGVRLSGLLDVVRVRTNDGSVFVRLEEPREMKGDWEIGTSDGTLRLELPEDFGARLDARTGDGRVVVEGLRLAEDARRTRRSVQGTLGPGGPLLRLRTGDGTIRVSSHRHVMVER